MTHGTDNYDDLASFDGSFVPQAAFRPGLETLADGEYDFTVIDARLDFASTGQRILKVGLKTHTGATVEHTYWLTTQEGMNRLGADMLCLGFPANKWGTAGGESLSTAIPNALKKLPGMKFRATKKARVNKNDPARPWQDLYISGPVKGQSMPAGPRANGTPAHATADATAGDSIPF